MGRAKGQTTDDGLTPKFISKGAAVTSVSSVSPRDTRKSPEAPCMASKEEEVGSRRLHRC